MSDLGEAAERLQEYIDAGGEFEEGRSEPEDWMSDWRDNHSQEDLWVLAVDSLKTRSAKLLAELSDEEREAEGWKPLHKTQDELKRWMTPCGEVYWAGDTCVRIYIRGELKRITTLGQLSHLTAAVGATAP